MESRNTMLRSRIARLSIVILLGLFHYSGAQYGYEWMTPGKQYIRIKTYSSGIHTLFKSDLAAAGLPADADPETFRLHRRGKEQLIHISGAADHTFDNTDTVFFYGERNDGTPDQSQYRNPAHHVNKRINLYSDTSVYYLSWGGAVSMHRMPLLQPLASQSLDHHVEEIVKLFKEDYSRGATYDKNTASFFDLGEGWCSTFFDQSDPYLYTLSGITNVYTPGTASITVRLVGINKFNTKKVVLKLGSAGSPFLTDTISGFTLTESIEKTISFPASLLGATLPVQLIPIGNETNVVAIQYSVLRYPQASAGSYAGSKVLQFDALASATTVQTAWTGPDAYCFDITHADSVQRISSVFSGGIVTTAVPASCKKMWMSNGTSFLKPFSVSGFQCTLPDTTGNYLILSHSKLRASTQEYAQYRASAAGGAYEVRVEEVDRLYDIFSYGEFTPTAILRYCNYIRDKNPDAAYLLLAGKSLDLSYSKYEGFKNKVFPRWNPSFFQNHSDESFHLENLVPTYGSPASDQYYAMNSAFKPFLAVGRISARDNEQLLAYLDKVKQHEDLDSNYLWRKHLVHLSGGQDIGEIGNFRDYVNSLKTKVENSLWGGKVIKSLHKELNDGVVSHVSISDEVNAGVSYITYYGHSAPTLTEMDLGNVSDETFMYNNQPRYPMLILNGCASGSVYANYSTAEDWLNTPKKGAILVFGSSDEAYTIQLMNYTNKYYDVAFDNKNFIGKPTGDLLKYILNSSGGELNQFIRTQMNLQGDPAIRMYMPSQPDYEISGDEEDRDDDPEPKVFLKTPDGSKLTAATPEFTIGIPVKNLGVFVKDSFNILIKRIVNGTTLIYGPFMEAAIRYYDTVYVDIKGNDQISFFGINRFEIYIDPSNAIAEMKEDNNVATLNYFMPVSAVTCLFPKEFSIVHRQPVTLVAQSTDLMVDRMEYYFELDTSWYFNSPFKRTTVISSGALVKWENQFLLSDNALDSTVYFWRVRLNSIPGGQDTIWSTSSFMYIKNSPDGWSQSHPGQFQKDNFRNLKVSVPQGAWEFLNSSQHLVARSYGNGDVADINDKTSVSVGLYRILFPGYWLIPCQDGYRENYGENTSTEFDGMYAIAFHKSTLEPYLDMPGAKCGRLPFTYLSPHIDLANPSRRANFVTWLNAVPDDYVVLMGSSGNASFNEWGDKNTPGTLRHALFTQFGAALLDSLHNNEPYILLSVKGGTPIAEKHTNDVFGAVALDTTVVSKYNHGRLYSTLVGPSRQWGTYYKKLDAPDGSDRHMFGIVRYQLNGTSDTLRNLSFSKNADNIDTLDLSTIVPDAETFPYVKLFVEKYDSLNLTPPQLKKWQVIYHKVPEGSMNPFLAGLSQYSDGTRREEGQQICYSYVFENISDLPFDDSLQVTASVFSASTGQRDSTFLIKTDSLDPGESFSFTHCFQTKGVSGTSSFRMFVNPHLQPEEYYNNNVIETTFDILRDKTPPVIDVTYDGVHIMEGDLVSPSPVIQIKLNDNSEFLLMNDPSKVSLFIKREGASGPETILFTNPDILRYGQESGNSNTFSIEYHPKNLPDGKHTLIVQGTDVNGNKSGSLLYSTFEVVNASTISNIYPYPNPFSTSTQFVFTLTGNELPEDMKIQIMTVTGKVVKEIMKADLGPLHAGHNRTEYAWDGRDEFGDKLANGVYLYRVMIKNKGGNFEHRATAGDKAFTKEFGKIYILR